jgi:hypothetical protein
MRIMVTDRGRSYGAAFDDAERRVGSPPRRYEATWGLVMGGPLSESMDKAHSSHHLTACGLLHVFIGGCASKGHYHADRRERRTLGLSPRSHAWRLFSHRRRLACSRSVALLLRLPQSLLP